MSEISCRISNTFISYVKNTRPEFLQPLLDGLGYDEKYLSDPDNWIPWETEQLLEERITHLFDDERIMFKIGRSILKFKSLGIVNMLLRLFMTPELLILYTPKIARYFTKDIVNINVINTTRESAIVELKIKGRQTRGACLYNQGMFSIITELFGLEAASVSELQCVVPLHEAGKINGHFYMVNEKGEVKELKEQGDTAGATRRVAPAAIGRVSENGTFKLGDTLFGAESCIYQINWKNKWRSSLHNRIFEKRRVLTDAIRHLEESHAKIQEAYERVWKSEERYRELIENASDIIIFLDSKDEITSINKKGIELFGYSHSEITGRKFLSFVDDIDKEKAAKELSKSLSGNTSIFEVIAKKKDDEQLILSVNSTPIREDGKIIGIMVIARDITHEKKITIRLLEIEKFAAKGMVAAEIAHEINNSLANIETGLFIIKNIRIDSPYRRDLLDDIYEEIERMSGIVKGILEVYRSGDSGIQSVGINTEIEKVIKMVQRRLKGKGIAILSKLSHDLPSVPCCPGHIKQILLNLIKNAEEAMDSSISRLIVIRTEGKGDSINIIVSDTGCGIPKRRIGTIFSSSFTSKTEGTGLGLSICHEIVKGYNGEIAIESEEGKGTTVIVSLPCGGTNG